MLVVGGAGVFGSRLVAGLLATTDFHVIVAGRSPARMAAFAAGYPNARLSTFQLDVRTATADDIRETGAFCVVDAAGPFQRGDTRLAQAAIAAGAHFIDLADARDFVAGFASLDAVARMAGVTALTGASSTPALSNAALDALTAGWRRIDAVEIAISPGNRAPRGLSVMQAILNYAGRPVRVFDAGRWQTQPGWGMTVRRTMPALGRRWLSLSETPDLDIVPARFNIRRSAVFRAGLELPVLHFGLWALSLLVRAGMLRSLVPFARPLRGLAAVFAPFGTDRGGMTVEATGVDGTGCPVRGRWWLLAEAGDGPYTPTLPALAALRALAAGQLPPGASACVGVLPLAAIEAEFTGRRITSGHTVAHPGPSLYETVLGPAFASLPLPIQRLHQPGWGLRARGRAQVEGGEGWAGRLVAAVLRFPTTEAAVAVSVDIVPGVRGELWVRDFGGRRFASVLSAAPTPGRMTERFGVLRFELDVQAGPAGVLGMPIRAWRLGRMSLPLRLAPVATATETLDETGRFWFDVALLLPFGLGRIVRYRGWLIPDGDAP